MIQWVIAFLFVCCLTMATALEPQFRRLHAGGDSSAGLLVALAGDSRQLFAHQFFAKADAYFHSGFYPTIFDMGKPGSEPDLVEESHSKPANAKDEPEPSFLGRPRDWIERFGRHFYPTVHTHLHGGNEREMMPWLKLAAELEPHEVVPYVTASYWLRTSLNKPAEAEQFLRQGLRANPDSYEILLELGRVYFYNRTNAFVARNIFEEALQKWRKQDAAAAKPGAAVEKPDAHAYEETWGEIVRVDQAQGNLKQQLADMEELLKVAQAKDMVQKQIDELKAKLDVKKP